MSTIFSGTSRYSSDFQSIIDRSVAISSLHLKQMQYQAQDLSAQSTALSELDKTFETLQAAIESIQDSFGDASYSTATSSASVTASLGSGAMEGSYSVEVVSLGSASSTISLGSLPAVANPYTQSISASGTFTLTVDGTDYTVAPGSGSLTALAEAINASDADVQATIVNTGGSGSPSYRLAIRSSKLGAHCIQLNDGSADLLSTLATGAPAQYKVNGLDQVIESDSGTVTLAPGLTVSLVAPTNGQSVTIDVTRQTASLEMALSEFVVGYNAAVDAIDAHRGKNAGVLTGQSVLSELSTALRKMAMFKNPAGAITSMTSFGLELDRAGKLSLDSSKLEGANAADLQNFLGSTTSAGFLKAAYDALDAVERPGSGALENVMTRITEQIQRQNDAIAEEQERISLLQTGLEQKMAAADALIASLELQVTYMTDLFTSMRESSNQ